jgi:AcrR family transcriptional regulator
VTRREEVLDAAVRVTAAGGIRGLTHRAVDAEGDLPPGTASNYFRSKQALTTAAFERLGDVMADTIANIGSAPVTCVEDLIVTLGGSLQLSLGPGRVFAGAGAAMFAEAAIDESLHPTVVRTNLLWWAAIEGLLRDAGITQDVQRKARFLLSYGNGLVMDQMALRDPDFDGEAAMRAAILGFA